MNRERRQLSWRSRSFVYRLGLRPGSVRLRSWAPDVHYRAFSSWANSRGRAPPPRRVTLKCARFAGSSKLRATQKKKSSIQQGSTFFPPGDTLFRAPAADVAISAACRQASISLRSLSLAVATGFLVSTTSLGVIVSLRQQGSTFFCSTFFPPGDNLFRAPAAAVAKSVACRRASVSLRSLGLAVATGFLLSTTSLGVSCSASSTTFAFPHWDTSTVLLQCKQQQQYLYNTKLGLIPLFSRVNSTFFFYRIKYE